MYDACETLGIAIKAAMDAVPVVGTQFEVEPNETTAMIDNGQIICGDPLVPEFVQIMGQPAGQWQISIFPIGKAKSTARFSPYDLPIVGQSASPTLFATVADGVITFSGTVGASPMNIHTVVNGEGDAYYQAQPGDSPAAIAAAVEAAVNALDLEGVTATVSGDGVSIIGATSSLFCNVVGNIGTVSYEVGRFERTLDVSVWANYPEVRGIISEAIETRVGNTMQTFIEMPDGTLMYVSLDGEGVDDDSQSGYSVYRTHLFFTVEYGLMLTSKVAQLGVIVNDITINNKPAVLYVGGVPTGG
jgi:hypothetical protein